MSTESGGQNKVAVLWLVVAVFLGVAAAAMLVSGYPVAALAALGPALYFLSRWQRSRHERLDPGPMTLRLSPDPGALQGDVAGSVHSDNPQLARAQIYFQLRCVQVQERVKGAVIEHRKTVRWQARQPAYQKDEGQGVVLYFQFSPPQGLAASEPKPGLEEGHWQHYHYWELVLSGNLEGTPLAIQRFRPSVKPGQARAAVTLPEAWRTDLAAEEAPLEALPQALRARLDLVETEEGLELQDASGPPRVTALSLGAGGALIWGLGGFWLGLPLLLPAVWLVGRLGWVGLRPGHATVIRQWFGRALYARNGPLLRASQLELAPVLVPPLFTGGEPRYRLCFRGEGKRLVLVRDLHSQAEGEQLRRYLVRQLGLAE